MARLLQRKHGDVNGKATAVSAFRWRRKTAGQTPGTQRADPQEAVMSFMLYIVGLIVLISGLIYGAWLLNVPQQWIVVGAVIVAGLGILSGVARTRSKDRPE
jgi:hypothetical protein